MFFALWELQVAEVIYLILAYHQAIKHIMFKAIGFVIGLYAITQMMSSSFTAFENATTAMFETLEAAAVTSKLQIEQVQ